MRSHATIASDASLRAALDGLPAVDFPENLRAALAAGRRHLAILREVVALRRGPGKLTPQEYFYYRLWDPELSREEKLRFVGKQAQNPMHFACNAVGWHAAADDKLLFQTIMAGAGLPVPPLRATVHPGRRIPNVPALADETAVTGFLIDPVSYPFFAKPIDGKYSLGVFRADGYDRASGQIVMRGGGRSAIADCVRALIEHPAGYLLQRALEPHSAIAAAGGDRLWSVRLLMLLSPAGPELAQAVVKIPTGTNVADNFWRPGNLVAAVNPETGVIERVVQGSGRDLAVDEDHPDTGVNLVGMAIPDWSMAVGLCARAAVMLPGIRTQSWDVALTDAGPVLLEVNWGGDLNLAQLAWGRGVLDARYRAHLRRCGYRL